MKEPCTFIEVLRDELLVPHPRAHRQPLVGGRSLVVKAQDAVSLSSYYRLVDDHEMLNYPGQSFADRITWDGDVAGGWRPVADVESTVVVQPDVRFGRLEPWLMRGACSCPLLLRRGLLKLAHTVARLRADRTYPGDPDEEIHRRQRAPWPIARGAKDTVWLPEVTRLGWLVITRDHNTRENPAERRAVRETDARMIALGSRRQYLEPAGALFWSIGVGSRICERSPVGSSTLRSLETHALLD